MTTLSLELERHCQELSPEETDEVIEAMADLIVDYLLGNGKEHERDNEQSEC
jgi:hypothetical protein